MFSLLGVSDTTLRLTSTVFFAITLLAIAALLRRMFPGQFLVQFYGVLAAGLLPWFFAMSRIAFEMNTQLTCAALSLLAVHWAFERPKPSVFAASLTGIMIGISLYTYSTSRLLTFVFFLCVALTYFRCRIWRQSLALTGAFLLITIPHFWYSFTHPGALTARFHTVSYVYNPALSLLQKAGAFLKVYLLHISPNFLLLHGDPNKRHATGTSGELYFIVFLLAFIGIGACLWQWWKRERFAALLLLLLVTSLVAVALTNHAVPHAHRSLLFGLFALLLSAVGFAFVQEKAAHSWRPLVTCIVFICLAYESGVYVHRYFTVYAQETAKHFEGYGIRESLLVARQAQPERLVVYPGVPDPQLQFYLHAFPLGIPMTRDVRAPLANSCVLYWHTEESTLSVPTGVSWSTTDSLVRLRCYR